MLDCLGPLKGVYASTALTFSSCLSPGPVSIVDRQAIRDVSVLEGSKVPHTNLEIPQGHVLINKYCITIM